MGEWWKLCAEATFPRAHGALRAVAELFSGEQTEETIKFARSWLRRRAHFTTGYLLETLATKVAPRVVVEKSTSNVYQPEIAAPRGADVSGRPVHPFRAAPARARRIGFEISARARKGGPRAGDALDAPSGGLARRERLRDGTRSAARLARLACEHPKFLESVPPEQHTRIRGEDILTDPDRHLRQIAEWLGLRTDAEAIEEMKHPERSPYACFGPPGARFGKDRFFLENPVLRASRAEPQSLEGPLSWRTDGEGFSPKVKRRAREFGYE